MWGEGILLSEGGSGSPDYESQRGGDTCALDWGGGQRVVSGLDVARAVLSGLVWPLPWLSDFWASAYPSFTEQI